MSVTQRLSKSTDSLMQLEIPYKISKSNARNAVSVFPKVQQNAYNSENTIKTEGRRKKADRKGGKSSRQEEPPTKKEPKIEVEDEDLEKEFQDFLNNEVGKKIDAQRIDSKQFLEDLKLSPDTKKKILVSSKDMEPIKSPTRMYAGYG